MTQHPIVKVMWTDSSSMSGWCEPEEALAHSPASCTTVGWLIKEVNDHVLLAQSISRHDGSEVTQYGDVIAIPQNCMSLIQKLSLAL